MAERPEEEEDTEVHSDDDDDDLKKPAWVGYFRLPKADVELGDPFLPTDEFLPDAAKRKARVNPAAAEMYSGWWMRRKTTGEAIGGRMKVLIKPVGFLSEREARILSIIAGNDESAAKYNVTRFYGAVLYPPTAEYRVVLEYCDMGYLRDHVLNKKNNFDPEDFAKQIANGMRYLHYGAPYHPIIHRNLHPLSVLLKKSADGKIVLKLHGFQHAKIMAEHETFGGQTVAPTNPGLWLGPELNLGKTTTDLASDVYSFGMVVWHLFSRKLPFEGKRMTEPQIMTLTGTKKQRPAMPPYQGCPPFWVTLIDRCWQDQTTERPDFIKIMKAMNQKKESVLDPQRALTDAELAEGKEIIESWELDPDTRPTEGEQILSSNKSTSTVVVARYEESVPGKKAKPVLKEIVALKKPVKLTTDRPTKAEFRAFMETAKRISHANILECRGVMLSESIEMPLMEFSVRQYTKGKRIKDSANRRKTVFKGFGSLRDTQVTHIMKCVLKGLDYLHTTTGIAHGGLSTSNVLINKKSKDPWEVKLCDYNIAALGISSHSHNKLCGTAPNSLEGTPRGDLYSCGIMFVEMSTGKDRILDDKKKKKDWDNARSEVKRKYSKIWKAVAHCEDCSRHNDLSASNVLAFL